MMMYARRTRYIDHPRARVTVIIVIIITRGGVGDDDGIIFFIYIYIFNNYDIISTYSINSKY